MKIDILNMQGEKIKEINLPEFFSEKVREDLILKVYLASLRKQPYAPYLWAGMQHSASGKIRHARRKWKTAYGYGISRVPRKIHTRRGSRFSWVGATISSARGGREAHPPKILGMQRFKKINKKEKIKAIKNALAATASLYFVKKKYKNFEGKVPIAVEGKICDAKTKEVIAFLKKAYPNNYDKILLVTADKEKLKTKAVESVNIKMLNMQQLASGGSPGRIIIYTENAIKQLEERFGK